MSSLISVLVVSFLTGGPDFVKDVAPILQTYCLGCHHSADPQGGLDMHTFSLLMKGGENGAVIVPSKSAESRLYQLVSGAAEPKMPPEDNPAPSEKDRETLKAWIDAGATAPPDPEASIASATKAPVIRPRKEVKPRVHALAWSPDGKLIAIGGYRRVQLVDAKTGFIERDLETPAGNVTSLGFSKDSTKLLSAGGEPGTTGEAILWNLASSAPQLRFAGHADSLYAAQLSPDEALVATAGYDKVIKLWNVSTGEWVRDLKGHNESVYALAFRPDGKVLASASGDRTVKLWGTSDGSRLETFQESLKDLFAVAFAPDGSQLWAAGVDNRIRAWRISPSAVEGSNERFESRFAHEGRILALAVRGQGDLLASSGDDKLVKIWDIPSLTEKRVLEVQSDWPKALAFSPDGNELIVGRLDGTLSVYNPSDGNKLRDVIPSPKPPPPPVLVRKMPLGLQRGNRQIVKLPGTNLEPALEILRDSRISAEVLTDSSAESLQVAFTVPADFPLGRTELKVKTPGGESAPLAAWIDTLPQRDEASETILVDANQPIAIWGRIGSSGETDRYEFSATEGDSIVVDVAGKSVGSSANFVVSIFDDSGRAITSKNDAGTDLDPLLVWSAPATGRYAVVVRDLQFTDSETHFYRLALGKIPFVLGVYPTGIAADLSSVVQLVGPNLPAEGTVTLTPSGAGEIDVPIDPSRYRSRRGFRVLARASSTLEVEPNDDPKSATPIVIPGQAAGRIEAGGSIDYFRFSAKRGEPWIFEVEASRRGSPLDARLDILAADGTPIDRVWLAAQRDSYVEFRNIDSVQTEIRCKNWEEMELDQLMYMNGEVARLFRHPRGPDSGFQFYSIGGQRRTYFDTNSAAHALEDSVYIVQPVPPGTDLVPNGLPVFKVPMSNDDASDRRLGSDSRLTFEAPADGEYLARVLDVRSEGGPEYTYLLTARAPAPDFHVTLDNREPTIHRGSGRDISFRIDRVDGFDGDVTIAVTGLPTGISLSQPIRIEPDHEQVSAVLFATGDAPAPTPEQLSAARWTATAQVQGATVTKPIAGIAKISLADNPAITVRVEPSAITLSPGGVVEATLVIERHGHNDRVTFEMPGLPHGVIVDNIGLNGILIPEGESRRTFFLSARPFVSETNRPFFARANEAGAQCSPPVMLHIRTGDLASGTAAASGP